MTKATNIQKRKDHVIRLSDLGFEQFIFLGQDPDTPEAVTAAHTVTNPFKLAEMIAKLLVAEPSLIRSFHTAVGTALEYLQTVDEQEGNLEQEVTVQ